MVSASSRVKTIKLALFFLLPVSEYSIIVKVHNSCSMNSIQVISNQTSIKSFHGDLFFVCDSECLDIVVAIQGKS